MTTSPPTPTPTATAPQPPSLTLTAEPRLVELLEVLGQSAKFDELMGYLEARCTGLAVWGHSLPDATMRLWAGGRVQELADLLTLYRNRHQLAQLGREVPAEPPREL